MCFCSIVSSRGEQQGAQNSVEFAVLVTEHSSNHGKRYQQVAKQECDACVLTLPFADKVAPDSGDPDKKKKKKKKKSKKKKKEEEDQGPPPKKSTLHIAPVLCGAAAAC